MALAASGSHLKGLSDTVVFMLLNKTKVGVRWDHKNNTPFELQNKVEMLGQMTFKCGLTENFLIYIKYSNDLCGQGKAILVVNFIQISY